MSNQRYTKRRQVNGQTQVYDTQMAAWVLLMHVSDCDYAASLPDTTTQIRDNPVLDQSSSLSSDFGVSSSGSDFGSGGFGGGFDGGCF